MEVGEKQEEKPARVKISTKYLEVDQEDQKLTKNWDFQRS
jgi:hypothetical protein